MYETQIIYALDNHIVHGQKLPTEKSRLVPEPIAPGLDGGQVLYVLTSLILNFRGR